MIDGDFVSLKRQDVSNIIQMGGTILFSARSERFMTKEGRRQAYDHLMKAGIDGVVAIGGDGTFTGAKVFMAEFPDVVFVGVPGTIDNDLYGTDRTIGYDTAVNTAMAAIDNIKDTANSHDRIFFVEVMGRDAGFIAMRTGIAVGAEAILIPETRTDISELVALLTRNHENQKFANIIVVSEGDDAGGAFKIAEKVKALLPFKADMRVTVLGHVQRGGRPTCLERVLASRLGMESVKALLDGQKGVMIGEISSKIVYTPFEKAIKHHQKLNPVLLEMVEILS
jgi:6-phosphofructokinase 1